jgi:hypothetical protein
MLTGCTIKSKKVNKELCINVKEQKYLENKDKKKRA